MAFSVWTGGLAVPLDARSRIRVAPIAGPETVVPDREREQPM
jgi:hypothetical protein